jgi:hypothetical protein
MGVVLSGGILAFKVIRIHLLELVFRAKDFAFPPAISLKLLTPWLLNMLIRIEAE